MAITLTELQSKLMLIDEISLLEVLDISSENIVERFLDKIEDRFDKLVFDFIDDEEESNDDIIYNDYEDCCIYSHCDNCNECTTSEELDEDGR